MNLPWYAWALGSTVFWGIFYLFVARLSPVLSPISMYWLPNIVLVAILPFTYTQLVADYTKLWNSGIDVKGTAVIAAVISIVASVMFYKALGMHTNSTQVSLIQISYPIFVSIFALILFGQNHFTPSTIIGGLLIMIGAGLIVWNN